MTIDEPAEGAVEEVQERTRPELLNDLLELSNQLREAEAAKKRDTKLHRDRITDLKADIARVSDSIKALDEAEG